MLYRYEKQRKLFALRDTIAESTKHEAIIITPSTGQQLSTIGNNRIAGNPQKCYYVLQEKENHEMSVNKPRFNSSVNSDPSRSISNSFNKTIKSHSMVNDRNGYVANTSFDDDMLDAAMMDIDTDGK